MRDQLAARRGMFPGVSGRLLTRRPGRSGNRCPERRPPCLFERRDFCTISPPFLHHKMQFQELCSRRAPKDVAKSGHALPLVQLPSPLCGCPILPRAFRSQTTCLPLGSAQNFTAPKKNFGKEKVKFWNSLKHLCQPSSLRAFVVPVADDISGNFKFMSRSVIFCHLVIRGQPNARPNPVQKRALDWRRRSPV